MSYNAKVYAAAEYAANVEEAAIAAQVLSDPSEDTRRVSSMQLPVQTSKKAKRADSKKAVIEKVEAE